VTEYQTKTLAPSTITEVSDDSTRKPHSITDIVQVVIRTFTQAVTEYQTKTMAPSTITKVSYQ
jgi:hypothetical protein